MNSDIANNVERKRYEMVVDGQVAHADYVIDGDVVTFTHTIVPPALEGRGIASRLILFALEDVKAKGLRVIAQCPFVAAYIRKHPEWEAVLA
jgi:predicted GNAT family acetyltransferase